jgi:hypothetical protein
LGAGLTFVKPNTPKFLELVVAVNLSTLGAHLIVAVVAHLPLSESLFCSWLVALRADNFFHLYYLADQADYFVVVR